MNTALKVPVPSPSPAPTRASGWKGTLALDYRLVEGRTVAHDRHDGPLRVLKALYPDGPHTCEHVLVHPPGGLVGGDELRVQAHLGPGTRVRMTTPGATRFYKSLGAPAVQRVALRVGEGARLEWLPMETLAYEHCRAVNECRISLAPSAQMMGWDLCCLGLPASGDDFRHGEVLQHLEIEGAWLERGRLRAEDRLLRESPLGLQGMPVVASMWCAAGSAWSEAERQALQDAALLVTRDGHGGVAAHGVTSPNDRVVVLRALAPRVEPVFEMFKQLRAAWHQALWGEPATLPRLWRL